MKDFRYIDGVSTLRLDQDKCIGCGMCQEVCPHGVLRLDDKKAAIVDLDGCMECGACAVNCPSGAIGLTPGVGCAALIVKKWLRPGKPAKCC